MMTAAGVVACVIIHLLLAWPVSMSDSIESNTLLSSHVKSRREAAMGGTSQGIGRCIRRTTIDTCRVYWAASFNDYATIRAFLTYDMDIDVPNLHESLPLYTAVYFNSFDVVTLLLEKGADMQATNLFEDTPFLYAVWMGYADIVALMMDAMKQRHQPLQESVKRRALRYAANAGRAETARALLAHQAVTTGEGHTLEWSLAHHAAYHGTADELAQILHDAPLSISFEDSVGALPLHYATCNNNAEIVQMLIDNNSPINARDADRWTPLHIAARNGSIDMILYLLRNHASIESLDKNGYSPIYLAALHGHANAVNVLRQFGANMASIMNNHRSILHRMMSLKHYDLVRMFIELGARTERDKTRGCSLLYLATLTGQCAVVNALIERSDNVAEMTSSGQILHAAASKGHYNLVKMLLSSGVDVNDTDNASRTPMHEAARHGHIDVLELLRISDGNLFAGDVDGMTPAFFAAQHGHFDVLAYTFAHSGGHNPFIPIESVSMYR